MAQLRLDLIALSQLEPQPRGFAFEKFLKQLFDAHGLEAREPFRLRGEQIDGSFQLSNDTYLVEAKWQSAPTGAGDLHAFQGKIDQKMAWTRGLFISNSGFTDDGLAAFGRGKRVICMDGLDLYESLDREIPINHVLDRKARRAAETGLPFARVRDLFP
jgi:Restriction endonuclease